MACSTPRESVPPAARGVSARPIDRSQMAAGIVCRELALVGEIQGSLLPTVLPDIPGIELASYYQPCERAGGDYFDIVPLTEGRWGFIMADVAGHGVSAAVIMAVMRALVHSNLPHTRVLPAQAFLEFMNKQLSGVYTRNGRFVTVWCAIFDPVTRLLTYASAGHPPARLVRDGGVIALDAAGGLPIGIDALSTYSEETVALQPGDRLVMYTDGITEARGCDNGKRAMFGAERLDRALMNAAALPASECLGQVIAAVDAFTQSREPVDDQTVLIARVSSRYT